MKTNYIGNAKIVNINKLPQVGERHEIYADKICIEVKIVGFKEDYIIYQATFCEKDVLHMLGDFYVDCCYWTYAVTKSQTTYINGFRASKKDMEALIERIKNRRIEVLVQTTKRGNIAIKTIDIF